jgi:hypothetical protein
MIVRANRTVAVERIMVVGRREFLAIGGQTSLLALASCAAGPFAPNRDSAGDDQVKSRVAAAVQAYDSQGNHRTATAGDSACADWLLAEARSLRAEVSLEPFDLNRVDPVACHLSADNRRIDGVPLFDATFTGSEGISGRLGPLGSNFEIGVTESEPSRLTDPGSEGRRAVLSEVRQSRHKGVVLVTRGSRAGLFLLNAPAFSNPSGPPTLQVSSAETTWLLEKARDHAEANLAVHVERKAAQGFNVTASVAGIDSTLAPIVISTPRSGWWRCAGERGGGLACWLEALRAVTARKPKCDCLFVAFSGHEIGWLGIQDYLKRRPDLIKRAHLWLHFGANVGTPSAPNMINASDDAFEQWAAGTMAKEGLAVNRNAKRGSVPFGEAAFVHRAGGRYVALVCDYELFHNEADRWPAAIEVSVLARYARAFATGIAQIAIT